ncbi:hypothetical protein BDR03DRAFT_1019692 [Suillus americanus]|nr:hypothetical protein BDR03DRAFT_1019692 [Suillus americanus]
MQNEFADEYNPVYEFHSECTGITLQLQTTTKYEMISLDSCSAIALWVVKSIDLRASF